MKLFAIVTATLMAVGGGSYYFLGSSHECSKGRCAMAPTPAPVAMSGGCCHDEDVPSCCQRQDECCAVQEACCAVATSVASVKKPDCCAAKEECCLVTAACCTVAGVKAAAKPIEIAGCCEACPTPTPTRNVSEAAKAIAGVK